MKELAPKYIDFFSQFTKSQTPSVQNIGLKGSEEPFLSLLKKEVPVKQIKDLENNPEANLFLFLNSFHKTFPFENLKDRLTRARDLMPEDSVLLFNAPISARRLFDESISLWLERILDHYKRKTLFVIGKGKQGNECIEHYLSHLGIGQDIRENNISSFDAKAKEDSLFIIAGSPEKEIKEYLIKTGIKEEQILAYSDLKQPRFTEYKNHKEVYIDPVKSPYKRRIWPASWFSFFFYELGFKHQSRIFFNIESSDSEIASILSVR